MPDSDEEYDAAEAEVAKKTLEEKVIESTAEKADSDSELDMDDMAKEMDEVEDSVY